ncbi:N-acetylmuramoyl-L-alanine amidase [Pajaroellobacter abortibovis]|nr:N-acetylmuramoyl-L-alanine amidase [Pajaroellobacter abortibovis]
MLQDSDVHYTVLLRETSLRVLTEGMVSAHYLICQEVIHVEIVYQLVEDYDWAWHAGNSAWGSRTELNDTSQRDRECESCVSSRCGRASPFSMQSGITFGSLGKVSLRSKRSFNL